MCNVRFRPVAVGGSIVWCWCEVLVIGKKSRENERTKNEKGRKEKKNREQKMKREGEWV